MNSKVLYITCIFIRLSLAVGWRTAGLLLTAITYVCYWGYCVAGCNNWLACVVLSVLELCQAEKGIILSMRLEMLCESKCEDLALKLAEAIHRCLRTRDSSFQEESAEQQLFYTIDIYIALLYKFKRIHDIIKEVIIWQNYILENYINFWCLDTLCFQEDTKIYYWKWESSGSFADLLGHSGCGIYRQPRSFIASSADSCINWPVLLDLPRDDFLLAEDKIHTSSFFYYLDQQMHDLLTIKSVSLLLI